MAYHFFIVGHHDNPLYELDRISGQASKSVTDQGRRGDGITLGISKLSLGEGEEARFQRQMMAWSALDTMDALQWTSQALYLKAFETFKEWTLSGFITSGNIRFILLHTLKNDDGIKSFFQDTWEVYIKTLLNPFYRVDQLLDSPEFDTRVKTSARRHLGS